MLKDNLNKEMNPKIAAVVIIIFGLILMAFFATQVNWSKFEPSIASIGFPILFLAIVLLFAYYVAFPKKHKLTSEATDQKLIDHIDSFNQKTTTIRKIIGVILVVILVFILLSFYFMPEQLVKWLSV